jgi:hypothetical protein
MSQVLEWRERLESAHKQLQDAMDGPDHPIKTIRKLSADFTL